MFKNFWLWLGKTETMIGLFAALVIFCVIIGDWIMALMNLNMVILAGLIYARDKVIASLERQNDVLEVKLAMSLGGLIALTPNEVMQVARWFDDWYENDPRGYGEFLKTVEFTKFVVACNGTLAAALKTVRAERAAYYA